MKLAFATLLALVSAQDEAATCTFTGSVYTDAECKTESTDEADKTLATETAKGFSDAATPGCASGVKTECEGTKLTLTTYGADDCTGDATAATDTVKNPIVTDYSVCTVIDDTATTKKYFMMTGANSLAAGAAVALAFVASQF